MRRTLSVRLSVCPSVPLSLPSVTSRHIANYNDTHCTFRHALRAAYRTAISAAQILVTIMFPISSFSCFSDPSNKLTQDTRRRRVTHLSRRVVAAFSAAGEVDAADHRLRSRWQLGGAGRQVARHGGEGQRTASADRGMVRGRRVVERTAGPRRPNAHVENVVEDALGCDDRLLVPAALFPVQPVDVVFRVQNDLLDLNIAQSPPSHHHPHVHTALIYLFI